MAIYHFSVQAISRGKGQSAVASASYRSGEKLMDEQTGEVKFYKRDVQPETMILAPDNAPEWVKDRQRLWNEVEKIEKNKNSRLAREINVALPVELSHGQQKELIKNYAKEQFVDKGMVADIAIHRDDANNPHAHIMLTIRPFDEKGEWQKQKSKKEYILDEKGNFTYNKKGEKRTRKTDLIGWDKKELVQEWRKEWSHHANKMLEREGINERIDHRSHKERGLETLPTQHVGYVASAMEKKGIETERGNYNRDVQAYNETVVDLQKYREQKHELERSNEPTRENKVEYTPQEATQLESAAKFLNGNVSIEG
ncbi:MobQ family relaxase [Ornithinibacillus contaminans]|uniref:MobQ family relaxase n=1 Tax=Ornithinibacillus contaminans TaxID=694055 RepID=UPI00069E5B15|nr:MobQ family relaxase [Ornithinibacillus contaminans]